MATCFLTWTAIVSSCFLFQLDVSAVHSNPILLSSTYHIIDKRPLGSVSDRFLSYTLEPEVLTHVADCREEHDSSELIRTLLPAYLRIAGPDSKKLRFQNQQDESSNVTSSNVHDQTILVTGPQWLEFINFAKNTTGLQIIISLNGNFEHEHSDLDLTNALEFITYSSKNNLDLNWELGYEFQKMSDHDGRVLGGEVAKLRKVLDVFPRYRKSMILGPDMTSLENRADVAFIQSYLSEAGDSLDAFTLHYDFSNLKEDDNVFEKLSPIFNRMDTYLWIKEGVLKTLTKGVVDKKSIWLSESENKDHFCSFSDTLSFIQRLGAAAKLGVSVYLRKPHLVSLSEPTSEYWAAVLFKSLVGTAVLDAKYVDGNNSKVFAFGHCTRILPKPDNSIINPNVAYKAGAITLYGVNTGSEWSRLFFKLNTRYEQVVHLYILTEDKGSYTGKTLFNRQELHLSEDNELPILFPRIREYAKHVVLPPKSVFFLVLPYANSRTCMTSINTSELSYVAKKKSSSSISGGNETSAVDLVGILEEDEPDDSAVYVSYSRKQESSTSPLTSSPKNANPPKNTKFITYSDDTWLSPLPNQLREIFYREPVRFKDDIVAPPSTSHSKKEKRVSKVENYRVITQALLGKRNISQNFSEELSRFSRSLDTQARKGEPNVFQNPLEEPPSRLSHSTDTYRKDEDECDKVHEAFRVEGYMFDVDGNGEIVDPNDEHLAHLRERRNTEEANSNSTITTVPPSVVVDNPSSFQRAVYPLDPKDNKDIHPGPEVSVDVPGTINKNLPSLPKHVGPLSRKSRKSKFSDELVLLHPTHRAVGMSVTTNLPLDSNFTPVNMVASDPIAITSTLDFRSDVDNPTMMTSEHASKITKTIVETTTIVDTSPGVFPMAKPLDTAAKVKENILKPELKADTPEGARSMIEPPNEEWETVQQVEENIRKSGHAAFVKPHREPKKAPISPMKRKPGYMSTTIPTTSTSKPSKRIRFTKSTSPPSSPSSMTTTIKQRRRIAKPTNKPSSYSTRKRAVKPNYDHGMRSVDTTQHKLIEESHAKLKQIVDANRAKIQTLKDKQIQWNLQHPRINLPLSRTKRDVIESTDVESSPRHYVHPNKASNSKSCECNLVNNAIGTAKVVRKDHSVNPKDLYSDVSENVRNKIHSLTSWIQEKYEEIKKELLSSRSKYDIIAVRRQIHNYSSRIQKELADIWERLRSINSHRSAKQLSEVGPAQVEVLDNRIPQENCPHCRHITIQKASVMTRNSITNESQELNTRHEHSEPSNALVNSRYKRSIETNEVFDENDDSYSPADQNQEKTSSLDYFVANMVDTKLRRVTSQFEMKTTVPAVGTGETINDGHDLRVDDLKTSDESLTDDEICDHNANVFAYLWCRCRDFLKVVLRVFSDN